MRNYNSIESSSRNVDQEDIALLLPSSIAGSPERRRANRSIPRLLLVVVLPLLLLTFVAAIILFPTFRSLEGRKPKQQEQEQDQWSDTAHQVAPQQQQIFYRGVSTTYQIRPPYRSHAQLEERLMKWEEWKAKIGGVGFLQDQDDNSTGSTTTSKTPERHDKNESSARLGSLWNDTVKTVQKESNVTSQLFRHGWNSTQHVVQHSWSKLRNASSPAIHRAWNATETTVQHGWNATETEVQHLWNTTEHKVEEAWDLTKEQMEQGWNHTETWFQVEVGDRIKHWWNATSYKSKVWINNETRAVKHWFQREEEAAIEFINDTEHAAVEWAQDEEKETIQWAYNITHNEHRRSYLVMRQPMYMNTTLAYHFLMTGRGLFLDYSHDYFLLQQGFDAQINQAYCAVATAVAVLNSFRGLTGYQLPIDPLYDPYAYATQHSILNNNPCVHANVIYQNETFDGVLSPPGGLSMSQTKALLECYLPRSKFKVKAVHLNPDDHNNENMTREAMRQDMIMALQDPLSRLMINYDRKVAGQVGGGHWSPIGSYSIELDAFLIMDVAKYKYPAAWIATSTIYQSLSKTKDNCGDWAFPHAQDLLPSVLATFPPTTEEDYHRAFTVLGCKPTHRGYIIVTRLPDDDDIKL